MEGKVRTLNAIIIVLCVLWPPALWAAETRHALVIGNAAYENETTLVNTLNDARDMAAQLEELGFQVTKVENAGRMALGREVNDFLRRIQGNDAPALFYYSGHGMQVGGKNYLIPVDAQVSDELDVPLAGIAVDRLLHGMGGRGDEAVNLVVLDACRNNPFKKDGTKAIGDKGLARVTAPSGTLILYATKPGETASDNPGGRNGLFTQHLLDAMQEPGIEVEQAFKQVAYQVYRESGRRQSPWQEGVIYGRFYFRPHPLTGQPVPAPPPPPASVRPTGHLQVNVDRPNAEVWLDGRKVGEASPGEPLNLSYQKVGAAALEVRAKGYQDARQQVTIKANQWAQAVVSLEPEQAAPPPAPVAQSRESYEPEMVSIPGGSFRMGSNDGGADEKPVHTVSIRPFKLGKYEVTQAQWKAVMGDNPSYFENCDDCPVEQVSWDDVQDYIAKLNRKTGKGYRLPSEAEWEYACRSGGKDERYCGGNNPDSLGWYGSNSGKKTHPVGRKQANGLGLYDMTGNVWEWTQDCWKGSYQGAPGDGSAWESGECGRRVLRGGSWDDRPWDLRAAIRLWNTRDNRYSYDSGFRLAQD